MTGILKPPPDEANEAATRRVWVYVTIQEVVDGHRYVTHRDKVVKEDHATAIRVELEKCVVMHEKRTQKP